MSRIYKSLDITGKKYGNLTAIEYSHTGKNYMQYWVFKCDCGKENKTFAGYHWKYIAPADDWKKSLIKVGGK